MRHDVKERLLAGKRAAAAQIEAVLAARAAGTLSRGELRERLHAYVLAKFDLDEEEAARAGRDLEALAAASLAKALATDPSLVAEEGRPATCDGARSVDMKQALLIMAAQRELGVRADGFRAALAGTTDELADVLWAALDALGRQQ